ncbi:large-conductance mechanosensitive channel protein MscL [Lactobacillus sp. PV037]|uniref:large-conductance mechanosensitive channel protein MscL n=1 Tax=unclassified Lactobacillus TaxID=2620435 RepID=UPI0022405028|nr:MULTISPECIES: large-conductance mechanosensitive channel protein MscL [unclassified Lactobacillus]QNQ82730.1 large-conductance mechanosensitive channel protein MscL [Lactobacillus sp. PV012]QNQ83151.1 large-conductance mechanosensitive channel protein MscL [Lactobacillus sp. PV037]
MIKEFKEFIARGDVMDLAVGVIIGAAFTAIVNSLVTNIINPLIGLFIGQIDLSNLKLTIGEATFKYGAFINSIINFLIIAFIVFLLMKIVNKITRRNKAKADEEEKELTQEQAYLKEIRDLLAQKNSN